MDRDDGPCRPITTVDGSLWPGGWYDRQAPERRSVRIELPPRQVSAVVGRRCIQVNPVPGWRVLGDASRAPGHGDGFARRAPALPPGEALERAEDAARIRAALDTLPGRYRQVLCLVYVEGRTHGEAAMHLAVPLGTAKAWVRRGVRAFRTAHASLDATPTHSMVSASRLLMALRFESRRPSHRPTRSVREVAVTRG